jgi:hypothetical protein
LSQDVIDGVRRQEVTARRYLAFRLTIALVPVELIDDILDVIDGVRRQVGLLREVLAQGPFSNTWHATDRSLLERRQ